MSKYDDFDVEKFIKKISQLSRENHIKIGIMIKNYEPSDPETIRKDIIREYTDGLRFKLNDLEGELLDRLVNFVERLDNATRK